jgi:ATP phosphoribosyltransferase
MPNLGYGACRLVVAVPESWVDVAHMIDLIDVAAEFKAAGRSFRVSTKYGSLTRAHLRAWGIHDFLLVDAEGALELQPSLEIADVIVDLTSSGTTLRDNRLKEIEGGTVLESAACLIGHVPSLRPLTAEGDSSALALLLDALDGVRTAAGWMQFEVMGQAAPGRSSAQAAAEVARALDQHGARHSCRGDVWTADGTEAWRVTGLIRAADLAACRGKLSMLGARRIVALPARFVYDSGETSTFAQLKRTLGLDARGDISLEL